VTDVENGVSVVEAKNAENSGNDGTGSTNGNSSGSSITSHDAGFAPLEITPNALTVLERRYLKKDADGKVTEKPEDMFRRVSGDIAQADLLYNPGAETVKTQAEFYNMMVRLEFMPNSPTLMNAGRELQQLSACFVLPIDDSMESIFDTLKNTALIHKSGGGTGFSFSRLRPRRDVVKSTQGVSSGPVSFMRVFDAATEAIKQGGTRRGANMGILRVDHPDIMDFIKSKEDSTQIQNFNISVAVTEDFMRAVELDDEYDLINPRGRKPQGKLNAKEVFKTIVEMAWKNGEPGIIFIDRINRDNPTPKLGEIESTNPCGEQPLLPYESCNLGSINLARMLAEKGGRKEIDWEKLRATTHGAVHFLDNVIDRNRYPLPKIQEMTTGNRKIGLGIMGFADMLLELGIPYDSNEALAAGEKVMKFILDEARKESTELARARGTFPNFRQSVFNQKKGAKIRNATLTTIAPTGTISIIAGCSSGIEPLFAIAYIRKVLDGDELVEVNPVFREMAEKRGFYSDALIKKIAEKGTIKHMDEVPEDVRRVFVTAHDIAPEWHIKMQATFQKHTDNAVSKTVNFPHDATVKDVEKVYWLAYKLGAKGVTIYRDRSRETQVLNITGGPGKTGDGKIKPRPRPMVTRGWTEKMMTECGNIYVTINEDEKGLCEVFAQMGKSGGCAASQSEAVSRLISLALRSGIDTEAILKQVKGIRCPMSRINRGGMVLSCPDAIAKAIERHLKLDETGIEPAIEAPPKETTLDHYGAKPDDDGDDDGRVMNMVGICPDCGGVLVHESGCAVCKMCAYTKCG
jgi:ribonucleoside-diphosphate reductase alpha chain